MIKKHLFTIFVGVIVLVPFTIYGIVKWAEDEYSELPVFPSKEHVIETFALLDQEGNKMTNEDWKGKTVVANFFFTHCPVVCPKMVKQLQRVQAFSKDENLVIASISVDPERDSVQRLKEYSTKVGIGKNWRLLTGDKKEIYRLARKGFLVVATDGDGGEDDFIHSERFVLLDGQSRIRGYYEGTDKAEVDQLINDIKKLQKN